MIPEIIFLSLFIILIFVELARAAVLDKDFYWWFGSVLGDAVILGILYIPAHLIVKHW